MKKGKLIICSVIGAIICSAVCIGYSGKNNNIETIKSEDCINSLNFNEHDSYNIEVDDYWEITSIDEIKNSILEYINDMMDSTINNLEEFKKENNENKIKLYENEVKRLNTILENVRLSKTKEDLRRAMQVRHKNNI